jgi:hypothetical protein
MLLNSGLTIMPTKNMINNVGISADSTHFSNTSLRTTPRQLRRIYTMRRFDAGFPLRHPTIMAEDIGYKERAYKVLAWGHPLIKLRYSIEELFLNLRYGNFRVIAQAIKNRIKKIRR